MKLLVVGSAPSAPFESIIEAVEKEALPVQVVAAISVTENCDLVRSARAANIPTEIVDIPPPSQSKGFYDRTLSERISQYDPDLIFLIGYCRILSPDFIEGWRGKIINIHGSLLPKYAGLMRQGTQAAVLAAGDKEAGCTVHVVTEQVDAGPILVQTVVAVLDNDTPDTLRNRIVGVAGDACVKAVRIMHRSWSKTARCELPE